MPGRNLVSPAFLVVPDGPAPRTQAVLIKKYGHRGTHLVQQQAALDRLAQSRRRPEPPQAVRADETADVEQSAAEPAPDTTPPEAADEAAPESTD